VSVTKEQADAIARRITAKATLLSSLAWDIDQVLFRMRVSDVGESGIKHRIIERRDYQNDLDAAVKAALEQE
jgi:hypothetical protein